jgi:hypothetical protein
MNDLCVTPVSVSSYDGKTVIKFESERDSWIYGNRYEIRMVIPKDHGLYLRDQTIGKLIDSKIPIQIYRFNTSPLHQNTEPDLVIDTLDTKIYIMK